jgi:hypothetical protein
MTMAASTKPTTWGAKVCTTLLSSLQSLVVLFPSSVQFTATADSCSSSHVRRTHLRPMHVKGLQETPCIPHTPFSETSKPSRTADRAVAARARHRALVVLLLVTHLQPFPCIYNIPAHPISTRALCSSIRIQNAPNNPCRDSSPPRGQ